MVSTPTEAQLETFVDFLERNPEIARGFLLTQQAKQEFKRKWNDMAPHINALGGVVKDGAGWSKYWAKKKRALKRLCAQHSKGIQRTGAETQALHSLSPLELRFVAVMGDQSFATGDRNVAVDPFPHRDASQFLLLDPQPSTSQAVDNLALKLEGPNPVQLENRPVFDAPSTETLRRRRRFQARNDRSQLDIEVERFQKIEERRVEYEMKTTQAMAEIANNLNNCANAIREGAHIVANALLEIARLPEHPS